MCAASSFQLRQIYQTNEYIKLSTLNDSVARSVQYYSHKINFDWLESSEKLFPMMSQTGCRDAKHFKNIFLRTLLSISWKKRSKAPQNELDKSFERKPVKRLTLAPQKKPHLKLHCSLFHRLCMKIFYSSAFCLWRIKFEFIKRFIHSNADVNRGFLGIIVDKFMQSLFEKWILIKVL